MAPTLTITPDIRSVVVITPTTGCPKLAKAIASVQNQTYKSVKHLIVVDGDQYTSPLRVNHSKALGDAINIEVVQLKTNTGGGGYYGHRIFAAFPHLVKEDYVFFLDQDNWYEPNHIEALVRQMDNYNLSFGYSLRTIWDGPDRMLFQDNCESLGKWPVWNDPNSFHIDTSAYAFRRTFLVQTCHIWHYGYGGDRRYFNAVKNLPDVRFGCSGQYSLCYRLGGNETSPSVQFFQAGNAAMAKQYGDQHEYPWKIVQ